MDVSHAPPAIVADSARLQQVLWNLITNAIKYSKPEGGHVHVAVVTRGGQVEIQVQDTGIGIAESDIGRLFQNFGQANRSTASQYGGTGLGLALSQKLCALMGGGISAVSEPGQGSCFTIRVLAWMTEQHAIDDSSSPVLQFAD
jgi:signal transduction histidine kinase